MEFVLENTFASSNLESMLNQQPPDFLYHYTGPDSLLGIIKNKELWATNIDHLADGYEIDYCVEYARNLIKFLVDSNTYANCNDLLVKMMEGAGSATRRYYLVSLSEESDSLPQWREYCPNGGYALAISSEHLTMISKEQNFRLVKCCYDAGLMNVVIREWISHFVSRFNDIISNGDLRKEATEYVSWQFSQHIARYGSVFKHESFHVESEWRIISNSIDETDRRVDFRVRNNVIVPFFHFSLVGVDNHSLLYRMESQRNSVWVKCGPLNSTPRSQITAGYLTRRYLGDASYGPSNIPHKTK